MASIAIRLLDNEWKEVGAIAHNGQFSGGGVCEIVAADSLPAVDAIMPQTKQVTTKVQLFYAAPASGSWYVRNNGKLTATYSYTEI